MSDRYDIGYDTGYEDGESSVSADIDNHLSEHCGQPDGDERTWAEYTSWMWAEITRLSTELDQQKRWGLEAHERAGGVEERLRTELEQLRSDWKTDVFELRKRIKEKDENLAELDEIRRITTVTEGESLPGYIRNLERFRDELVAECAQHVETIGDRNRSIEIAQGRISEFEGCIRKLKEWVDDEGWCPICDEHRCRQGNCVLAEIECGVDEDNYDYAADDLAFDAAREDAFFRR